jgi:hypothetical protein
MIVSFLPQSQQFKLQGPSSSLLLLRPLKALKTGFNKSQVSWLALLQIKKFAVQIFEKVELAKLDS